MKFLKIEEGSCNDVAHILQDESKFINTDHIITISNIKHGTNEGDATVIIEVAIGDRIDWIYCKGTAEEYVNKLKEIE